MTAADLVGRWLQELQDERSANTVDAYARDVRVWQRFLADRGVELTEVEPDDVEAFVRWFTEAPRRSGRPPADATVARTVSAVRALHRWLHAGGHSAHDPAAVIPPPPAVRSAPRVLDVDDVALLLSTPDPTTALGLRDRAVLATLVGTGVRAAELVELDLAAASSDHRTLHVSGSRPRPLPIPDPRPLRRWVEHGRGRLAADRGRDQDPLFVNARGERLTRQGAWLVVREQVVAAELPEGTSPRTLRHTFAALARADGTDEVTLRELLGTSPWTGRAGRR